MLIALVIGDQQAIATDLWERFLRSQNIAKEVTDALNPPQMPKQASDSAPWFTEDEIRPHIERLMRLGKELGAWTKDHDEIAENNVLALLFVTGRWSILRGCANWLSYLINETTAYTWNGERDLNHIARDAAELLHAKTGKQFDPTKPFRLLDE